MARRTRGSVVEGQVELHMSRHNRSSPHKARNWEEAQLVEARVAPSSLLRMWVWMISGWMAVIGSPPLRPAAAAAEVVVVEFVDKDMGIIGI